MCSNMATSSINQLRMKQKLEFQKVILHAYRDIDFLLQEGFDTNADDCEMDGVKNTIKELKECLVSLYYCPECDGTNLTEDKTRCRDCDGGPG